MDWYNETGLAWRVFGNDSTTAWKSTFFRVIYINVIVRIIFFGTVPANTMAEPGFRMSMDI